MSTRVATFLSSLLVFCLLVNIASPVDEKKPANIEIDNAFEDVFTSARNLAGWSLSAGGFEDDLVRGYDVGPDGSIYIVGSFTGSMIYGEGGVQATNMQGDEDFFVGKISSQGEWLWLVSGGSEGADNANDISVDVRDGSAYVTGSYCLGTAGISCNMQLSSLSPLGKASDDDDGYGWIARIDSSGNWQWAKNFGSSMDDQGMSVITDGNGSVYHSGLYMNMIEIGTEFLPGTEAYSLFFAKMDDSGTWEWAKAGTSPEGIEPFGGVCLDSMGQPWFTGSFTGSVMFEEKVLNSVGGADIYVIRMNKTGEFAITAIAGGAGDDWSHSCTVDGLGATTIVGNFENDFNAGSLNATSSGWLDAFIAAIDNNGTWQHLDTFGGNGYDVVHSMDITPNGEKVVVGSMTDSLTIGQNTLTSTGGSDVMFLTFSPNGTLSDAMTAGGPADDNGLGVAIGGDGSPIVLGTYQGTASFGTFSNTSEGALDFFLWQYAKDEDGDGIVDGSDNCPNIANPGQNDHDLDGEGDACEDDVDGDGLLDDADDCPEGSIGWTSNNETDHDSDGCHDYSEDLDDDEDGIPDTNDSCSKGPVGWVSTLEEDIDGDGCADVDTDGDGFVDQSDNCVNVINPDQSDKDGDGIGDACDGDIDGDGVSGDFDECPDGETNWQSNAETDNDDDGCRDSGEDTDDDGDGVSDNIDDCPKGEIGWSTATPGVDHDSDGCRDADEDDDDDGDGYKDTEDSCPLGEIGPAPLGQDFDNDGCNDIFEDDDLDNDGTPNDSDLCANTPIGSQTDASGCSDAQRDSDGDGVKDTDDQCADTPSDVAVNTDGCPRSESGNTGGSSSLNDEKSSGGLGIDPVILYGGGGVAILAVIAIIITMMGNKPPPRRDDDDEFGILTQDAMGSVQTAQVEQSQSSSIGGFTDEQLMSAGWTAEQIAAHRQR